MSQLAAGVIGECSPRHTQHRGELIAARADLPPGPSAPSLIQGIGFWSRPLAYMERCRARYGRRFTIRIPAAPPFVMLTDPDDIKVVFTAPPDVLHPGQGARVLEPIVGSNSVLLLDEDAHMSQRKLMLPSFHGEQMGRLAGLMEEVTEREVASWPASEPLELHPLMQRLTLEIILRAAFGLDPGPRLDALRERLAEMLAFGDRPISLAPPPKGGMAEKVLQRVGPFASFARMQAEADVLIYELIDERRREDPGDRDDILATLLAARHEDGEPMSQQELRDELLTLLVAGHETTASSLAWAFATLPHQPEALQRLADEVNDGDEDTYLTAVIYETLRHRPVLPNAQPRYVVKEIDVNGWTAPTGVCLVPQSYLLHHDAELYPDPYVFRPERFVGVKPGTYTWIPFGGGRRRCLGASFAIAEMKLVFRSVLRAWDVRSAGGDIELARRRNITVRPAGGARVVLGERKPAPVAAAA